MRVGVTVKQEGLQLRRHGRGFLLRHQRAPPPPLSRSGGDEELGKAAVGEEKI